jgi:hypothetical protein
MKSFIKIKKQGLIVNSKRFDCLTVGINTKAFYFLVIGITILIGSLTTSATFAQGAGIGESTFTPDASAILELKSTSKGLLLPRLNTVSVGYPIFGLLVYNSTLTGNGLSFYNGSNWLTLSTVTGTETLVNKTLTSPTLTTPILGVANATSINKVTITAPSTGSTITIANGKTLSVLNSISLTGTDATTMTFPNVSSNISLNAKGTLTNGSPVTVAFGSNNLYTLTPNISQTLNATGGIAGGYYSFIFTTSGTTSYTLTFGTNFKTAGTLSTGIVSGKVYVITFICDGTTFYEVSRTVAM